MTNCQALQLSGADWLFAIRSGKGGVLHDIVESCPAEAELRSEAKLCKGVRSGGIQPNVALMTTQSATILLAEL